jgi:hypothetical protein
MVPEQSLQNTGPEWFLILLDNIELEERAQLLFIYGGPGTYEMMLFMAVAQLPLWAQQGLL